MTDVHEIGEAVGTLIEATTDLGEALLRLDLPWEVAAAILDQIRTTRTDLQRVEADVERHITQAWKRGGIRGDYPIDGVGVVTVRNGAKRKNWDHPAVAAAVVDAHLTGGTGEVPDPWDVRDWIMDAIGPAYWRVTILAGLGLRAADFCTEEYGTPTVQIVKSGR